MIIVHADRGRGKSTNIVNRMHEDPGSICIVPNMQMAAHLIDDLCRADFDEKAAEREVRELESKRFYSPGTMHHILGRRAPSQVFVDELDHVLNGFIGTSGCSVTLATFTGEIQEL